MEENVITTSESDGPCTTFKGCESELSQRIRRILESNFDLLEWNSDYTELEEFFGSHVQFIDFSLQSKGWYGEILLMTGAVESRYLKNGEASTEIEILEIISSCELQVPKKCLKKLTAHLNLLNGELPRAYGSFFYQDPGDGQVQLISRISKPGSSISDQEIAFFLAAHKAITHEFFPGVNQLIEGEL